MREGTLATWVADGLYWVFFALSLLCFCFVPFIFVRCGVFRCSEPEWSLPFGILGMASLFLITLAIVIRRILTGDFQNPYKRASKILFWLTVAGGVVLGATQREQTRTSGPETSTSEVSATTATSTPQAR